MMDREKKDELPKMQGEIDDEGHFEYFAKRFFFRLVGFIDSICLPLYKVN